MYGPDEAEQTAVDEARERLDREVEERCEADGHPLDGYRCYCGERWAADDESGEF